MAIVKFGSLEQAKSALAEGKSSGNRLRVTIKAAAPTPLLVAPRNSSQKKTTEKFAGVAEQWKKLMDDPTKVGCVSRITPPHAARR